MVISNLPASVPAHNERAHLRICTFPAGQISVEEFLQLLDLRLEELSQSGSEGVIERRKRHRRPLLPPPLRFD